MSCFDLHRGLTNGLQILTRGQQILTTKELWRQKTLDIHNVVSGRLLKHHQRQPIKILRAVQNLLLSHIKHKKVGKIIETRAAIQEYSNERHTFSSASC